MRIKFLTPSTYNKKIRHLRMSLIKQESCFSDKLDPNHLQQLVQHHQIISTPLLEEIIVGAMFQALFTTKISNLSQEQQLHCGTVEDCIFK